MVIPFILVGLSVILAEAGLHPAALKGWVSFGWVMLAAVVFVGFLPFIRQQWPWFWKLFAAAIYLPVMGAAAFSFLLVFSCAYTRNCV